MLQAFIDDSISSQDGRRMFLAGYVAPDHVWRSFRTAWLEELCTPPAIRFLHMVEAQHLRGEFSGWSPSDRDAKVLRLARLIFAHHLFSFETSIGTKNHNAMFEGRAPFGLARPYTTAAHAVAASLARCLYEQGVRKPIHFTFDTQQGADKDIEVLWPWLKASSPGPWRDLLGPAPKFEDDNVELALQAADMLVWHRRRLAEGIDPPDTLEASDYLISNPHLVAAVPDGYLAATAEEIARVPGVQYLQRKTEWRNLRDAIAARHQAGLGPPRLGPQLTLLAYTIRHPLAMLRTLANRRRAQRGRLAASQREHRPPRL